jgi:hypothetical protein
LHFTKDADGSVTVEAVARSKTKASETKDLILPELPEKSDCPKELSTDNRLFKQEILAVKSGSKLNDIE